MPRQYFFAPSSRFRDLVILTLILSKSDRFYIRIKTHELGFFRLFAGRKYLK